MLQIAQSNTLGPQSRYYPEGPSSKYLRLLVPKAILFIVFGLRNLKYWVLGPSGLFFKFQGFLALGKDWSLRKSLQQPYLEMRVLDAALNGKEDSGKLAIKVSMPLQSKAREFLAIQRLHVVLYGQYS